MCNVQLRPDTSVDFYNVMKSACEGCYGGKSDLENQLMLWACKQWATYYHDAVQMFGVSAYLNDNQLARCHCACEK